MNVAKIKINKKVDRQKVIEWILFWLQNISNKLGMPHACIFCMTWLQSLEA